MYKVASSFDLAEGSRLHVRVEQRYITLFRHRGVLSAIDAICHHAGGPLTLGPIRDIEELGMAVVLCPWHKFMVSIDGGIKAYQVRLAAIVPWFSCMELRSPFLPFLHLNPLDVKI